MIKQLYIIGRNVFLELIETKKFVLNSNETFRSKFGVKHYKKVDYYYLLIQWILTNLF